MRAFPARKPAGRTRKPVVFLDRDGVLVHNRHGYYLTDPAKIRLYPFAAEALKLLADEGFRLIILTNQSAVERGYMTLRAAVEINRRIVRELAAGGGGPDAVYFCPHAPGKGCSCRKPSTGLLKEALEEFPGPRSSCWMVGDKFSDIRMGEAGGLKSVLVLTGQGYSQLKKEGALPDGVPVARNLLSAARLIISARQKVK